MKRHLNGRTDLKKNPELIPLAKEFVNQYTKKPEDIN